MYIIYYCICKNICERLGIYLFANLLVVRGAESDQSSEINEQLLVKFYI